MVLFHSFLLVFLIRHVALQTVGLIGHVFIFLSSCAKAEAKLIGGIRLPKINGWKIVRAEMDMMSSNRST